MRTWRINVGVPEDARGIINCSIDNWHLSKVG